MGFIFSTVSSFEVAPIPSPPPPPAPQIKESVAGMQLPMLANGWGGGREGMELIIAVTCGKCSKKAAFWLSQFHFI
jgi:hypothetical protein